MPSKPETDPTSLPPNELALMILKKIKERGNGRPLTESCQSMTFLREARSGEMYRTDEANREVG